MNSLKKFSFTIMMATTLLNCQGRKAYDRDPLADSYKKIDQGDYNGAIQSLEDLNHKESKPEVKVALASAYAARAGLKINQFWDFVQALKAPPITDKQLEDHTLFVRHKETQATNTKLLNSNMKKDLELLAKIMSAFELYRSKLETLPYVAPENREDLEKGVQVLSDVETKGGRLYRALLNLVYSRSDLRDGFEDWEDLENRLNGLNTQNPKDPKNIEILCSLENLVPFQEWLGGQFERIKTISFDIKKAFPSKATELVAFDFTVQSLQKELPKVRRTLVPGGCKK